MSSNTCRPPSIVADTSFPSSLGQIKISNQLVHVLPSCDGDVISGHQASVASFIRHTALERSSQEDQTPFFVIDLGDIVRKYRSWVDSLPNVVPHYAVKCNDDPVIMSVLAHLGAGFDCASKNEIHRVSLVNNCG